MQGTRERGNVNEGLTAIHTVQHVPGSPTDQADQFELVKQYIEFTASTVVYPKNIEADYLKFGILSEAGEVAALYKRALRDGAAVVADNEAKELGDCAWYLARMTPNAETWMIAMDAIGEYIDRYQYSHLLQVMATDPNALRRIAAFCALCLMRGHKPIEVMAMNVVKLTSRKNRGVIHGKGGER
jgi:hypothetical protein